jgi:hypothetical protein
MKGTTVNQLTVTPELSYLAEFSFDNDFADAAGSRGDFPDSISIQGNHFSFSTAEGDTDAPDPLRLHFVVLGVKKPMTYTYYEGNYDPNDATPPTWVSHDGIFLDSGLELVPLNDEQKAAMKWGSATSKLTGKTTMAARSHKHLVVKVMGVDGMWLLRIPPASINKYWGPMVQKLKELSDAEKAKHGKATLSLATCVIEASFVNGAMGVLQFQPKGYLAGDEVAKVAEMHKDREAIEKMLWGPEGSARKAQYEAKVAAPVVATMVPQTESVEVKATKPAPRRSASTTSKNEDVAKILQGMGL